MRRLLDCIDRYGKRWLAYWHGEHEPHQYDAYRCDGCRGVVTHKHIRAGGCPCGTSIRVRPAVLTRLEKLRLLLLPWSV